MKTGGLSLDQAPAEDIPLRFFISAPIFGILAGLMVFLKGNLLFSNTWMPETVALTHLLTLGWMGSVMFGALYQMIPVLVGGIVPFPKLSRMLHTILIPAILLMVSGFFWNHSWMLKVSLALLFPTILLFLLQLVQRSRLAGAHLAHLRQGLRAPSRKVVAELLQILWPLLLD